jgi:DNA-binding NtrC family response regulator
VLRRLGYGTLEASTGREGIQISRRMAGELDLLLTDVRVGDVSGFVVAASFREHNPGRAVVYTSGYSDEEMLRRAAREGGAFLEKPYDVHRLARVVQDALVASREAGAREPRRESGSS